MKPKRSGSSKKRKLFTAGVAGGEDEVNMPQVVDFNDATAVKEIDE